MEKRCDYIVWGKVDKKIILIIIGSLSKFFISLIALKLGNKMENHPLIYNLNAGIGMCLSIFPFIYIKIITKKKIKKENSINRISLIYTNVSEIHYDNIRIQKFLLILLSSIFDFGQKFVTFYNNENIENNFWIFDLFFLCIFSIIILKTKLYKFQYLSLSIIIFLGIIINVINLYNAENKEIIIIILSIEIMYSLKNVINKYSIEYHFCLPYEIGFYEGFFSLVLNVILLNFTNLDNFYNYYKDLDKKEIFIFILIMICRWLFNIFGLLIVKEYTPSHIVLMLISGEIAFTFFISIIWKLIITIIIFIILLFMLLVFTEIIELNFWGLQYDTKKNITERAKENDDFSRNDSEDGEDDRISYDLKDIRHSRASI